MMKFYTLVTFLLLLTGIAQAQSPSLKGRLQDKAGKPALNITT